MIRPRWKLSAAASASAPSRWTRKENVWVASNWSLDFPVPKIPDGASIMEQFKIMAEAMLQYQTHRATSAFNMIRPDGTQTDAEGLHRRRGDGRSVGFEHRRQ